MSSAVRFGLHWTLLHVGLAACLFYFLRSHGVWFLLSEGILLLSLGLGFRAYSQGRLPNRLAQLGTELLKEQDFTAKFRSTGRSEVDDLILLFNSMSERLREERLLSSERNYFLERLLEAAPVAVIILDHHQTIAQINPEAGRLLRLDEPDIVGRPLTELGSDRSTLNSGDSAETRPLGTVLVELEPSGSTLVDFRGQQFKASAGHFFDRGFPRRFFVLEELTRELLDSERRAYGQLIRTISHEVGNSVGAVSSLLGSCREMASGLPAGDRDALQASLTIADTRLLGLSGFINGFAEVVRLPPPERRPCDLVPLIDDILHLFAPELKQASVRSEWLTRPRTVIVDADKNQLEQLVVNVFRNALEAVTALPDGERRVIAAAIEVDPHRTVLRLLDSGPGLAPEMRTEAFRPFTSTKRDGRGLGLALVQEIAARHGWQVWLGPGEVAAGYQTEFRLTLPSSRS